jgi:sugar (pentulose or hexulose) kinase
VRVVALDIGSSSVKAAVLQDSRIVGEAARCEFATQYGGGRAEVDPLQVRKALAKVTRELASRSKGADLLVLCAMAPSWLASDRKGRPLTPVVTHQDRRSVSVALEMEKRFGKSRHLRITGNRPFPGGMSSTTAAWFVQNEPAVLRKADLVGHLNTFLLRTWTGCRVTDSSNASFMGVYKTCTLGGWSDDLLDLVGLRRNQLPEVVEANQVAGRLLPEAARELHLAEGLPVLPGIMDTSAAVLLTGAKHGTLLNVSGSTDVLALTVDEPHPHELLLTRAQGIGRKWLAVSTIASAGTTLSWLRETLFADLSESAFYRLIAKTLKSPPAGGVRFDPYLAGDRLSIEQKQGGFSGLTLGTTRGELLYAAIDALATTSGRRIPLLKSVYGSFPQHVFVSGGVGVALAKVLHRDWPGKWTFRSQKEATLLGLAKLAEISTGA